MSRASSSLLLPGPEVLAPEDWPQVDHLVTEDDTPVDNIFSERQQRLLVEPLYSSWAGPGEGRPFLALANVGLFHTPDKPPLVPDMMLSLDVQAPADVWTKHNRSYFVWRYGKPPEVVVEIVSNLKGAEAGSKMRDYAQIGVAYYVIFDPEERLRAGLLRVYQKHENGYGPLDGMMLSAVGLGLTLWSGVYEGMNDKWLRWCDLDGHLILTGAERAEREHQWAEQERRRAEQERRRAEQEHRRAEQERRQAEQERQRAEQERQRAEQEHQRAERLAARLRALGIEPDEET